MPRRSWRKHAQILYQNQPQCELEHQERERRRAEARTGAVASSAPTTAHTDSSYAGVSQMSSSVSPPRRIELLLGRPRSSGEILICVWLHRVQGTLVARGTPPLPLPMREA